jgi:hypothetical protein
LFEHETAKEITVAKTTANETPPSIALARLQKTSKKGRKYPSIEVSDDINKPAIGHEI